MDKICSFRPRRQGSARAQARGTRRDPFVPLNLGAAMIYRHSHRTFTSNLCIIVRLPNGLPTGTLLRHCALGGITFRPQLCALDGANAVVRCVITRLPGGSARKGAAEAAAANVLAHLQCTWSSSESLPKASASTHTCGAPGCAVGCLPVTISAALAASEARPYSLLSSISRPRLARGAGSSE